MRNILPTASLVATLLVAGCASSGYKKADKTGSLITDFRNEIISIKTSVAATLDSLDTVVAQASVDPRKGYDRYAKSLSNVESALNRARKRSDEMKKQGQTYFDRWQNSLTNVTNPEIRALAEQRKEELKKTFDNIKTTLDKARALFDPWYSDAKDLNTFFANDLTATGINGARSMISKTREDGAALNKAIDEVIAELNVVAAALTPARSG